jgi:hypothetical protein
VELEFSGPLWFWRGPAPFHFVTVPEAESAAIASAAAMVTYGWGMIPAAVRAGATTWTTSLWPKGGGYIVPVKTQVRRAEQLEVGSTVTLHLTLTI